VCRPKNHFNMGVLLYKLLLIVIVAPIKVALLNRKFGSKIVRQRHRHITPVERLKP